MRHKFILPMISLSLAAVQTAGEVPPILTHEGYADPKAPIVGFLEGVGRGSRFGFIYHEGRWQEIFSHTPPKHVSSWSLVFDGQVKFAMNDLLKNAVVSPRDDEAQAITPVPDLKEMWRRLADAGLAATALQSDSYLLHRPFLLVNRERLQDPDGWRPLKEERISDRDMELLRKKIFQYWKPEFWLRDKNKNAPCPLLSDPKKMEQLAGDVRYTFADSAPPIAAPRGEFGGVSGQVLGGVYQSSRVLHFESAKLKARIIQVWVLPSHAFQVGCRVASRYPEKPSEGPYEIGPKVRSAFLLVEGKEPQFIGYDMNMIDAVDVLGRGRSLIFVTASNSYMIVDPEKGVVARLDLAGDYY